MAQQTINTGTAANDGTGDPIRTAFTKANANFTELYAGPGGATLDTDATLAANSDTKIPTQKAVKTFVSAAVAGLLDLKGGQDCSGNPNYPAASKGDAYVVTVAGKIGGASGTTVAVGDVFFASADNAGGTQAAVGSSWDVVVHSGGSLAGALLAANNLSDVSSVSTARTNLGLGTAATLSTTDIDERARDAIGAALVPGSNVTITPDDAGDTITIAVAAGGGTGSSVSGIFYSDGARVASTAVTTEEVLKTFTLPAGKLSHDGDTLRITAAGVFAANTHSKTLKLYFGTSTVSLTTSASTTTQWRFILDVVRRGAASVVYLTDIRAGSGAGSADATNISGNSTDTPDLSLSQVIKLTSTVGTGAAASDVVASIMRIEYLPAP